MNTFNGVPPEDVKRVRILTRVYALRLDTKLWAASRSMYYMIINAINRYWAEAG